MVKFQAELSERQQAELLAKKYHLETLTPDSHCVTGKTLWVVSDDGDNRQGADVFIIELSWPDARIICQGKADIGTWVAVTGRGVTIDGVSYTEYKNLGRR